MNISLVTPFLCSFIIFGTSTERSHQFEDDLGPLQQQLRDWKAKSIRLVQDKLELTRQLATTDPHQDNYQQKVRKASIDAHEMIIFLNNELHATQAKLSAAVDATQSLKDRVRPHLWAEKGHLEQNANQQIIDLQQLNADKHLRFEEQERERVIEMLRTEQRDSRKAELQQQQQIVGLQEQMSNVVGSLQALVKENEALQIRNSEHVQQIYALRLVHQLQLDHSQGVITQLKGAISLKDAVIREMQRAHQEQLEVGRITTAHQGRHIHDLLQKKEKSLRCNRLSREKKEAQNEVVALKEIIRKMSSP